jgi:carboxypeptidase PM20D1
MAPQMSGLLKFVFGNLWLTAPILPRLLASMGGEARALVMTTCAFTMARGSGAPNVLPETAEVTANLRISVHQSTQEVMDQLRLIAAKYDVECEKIYGHEPTAGGLLDSREAEILIEAIGKIYKNVNVAPYLMLAASDSHHFSSLARNVFKFTPFHLTSDLRGGIHGLDEKLPIDELERAIEFYKTLIRLVPSS